MIGELIDKIVREIIPIGYFSSILFIVVGVIQKDKRILICLGILILIAIYFL